jgi:membrane protein DedA with SNARE-associated domain
MVGAVLAAQSSDPSQLTGLVGWVADVIAALGAVGVALLTLLDNFFPPVPSEVVLPLAGYLASQDRLTLVGALAASTFGSVAGAAVLYWLGARLGRQRMDALVTKIPLVELDDVDRARQWFDRHGTAAVFFGRMVPGVRSLISIPAGSARMSLVTFMVATTLGSLLWNLGLVGAGYLLGRQWRTAGAYSDYLNYALVAALAVVILRFVWRRRHRIGSSPRRENMRT